MKLSTNSVQCFGFLPKMVIEFQKLSIYYAVCFVSWHMLFMSLRKLSKVLFMLFFKFWIIIPLNINLFGVFSYLRKSYYYEYIY